MNRVLKPLASLAIASSFLALTGGAAQAASWWDEPYLGLDGTTTCSTVNGLPSCVTNAGPNTTLSQGIFDVPITGDKYIYATSAVLMAAGANYDIARTVNYHDGTGQIAFPPLSWAGGDYIGITQGGFGDAGDLLSAGCGADWAGCLGVWDYTESWMGLPGGADAGQFISSSITFCLEAAGAQSCNGFVSQRINFPANVPEPATLALIGLGLAGLAFGRRKARRQG